MTFDLDHRWALAYDGHNHEDTYAERPSDEQVRETREAAPDGEVDLIYLTPDHHRLVVATWPALNEEAE